MMGFCVSGLFFLKFWHKTAERLFLIFGLAFFTLAVERLIIFYLDSDVQTEEYAYVYLFRLSAFVMILIGIIDKNRSQK